MNTQNRPISHAEIAALLTRSASQLDDSVAASLRQARVAALQKRRARAPLYSPETVGHYAHLLSAPQTAGQWLVTAVLLASVVVGGVNYWQYQQAQSLSHLDIAILTDDLPMEVFID